MNVVSSKGIQSIELPEFEDPAKGIREPGEGSNEVDTSSLGVVTDLVEEGMTARHDSECLASFKAFAKVISIKLNVSEITSS